MSDASSSSGPFARRASGGSLATGHDHFRDHFRELAERRAAKKGKPKSDAFAGSAATAGSYYDPFKPKPRAPAPPAPEQPHAYEDFRAELSPPPPRHVLSNGAELKVFEREEEADALMRADEKLEQRKVRRTRQSGKSTSLVLVSQSNVVAAAEPATETSGGQDELVIPDSSTSKTREARRSGAGGGGGGASGGGGGRKPPPQIDRAFNQDDLVAVLLVLALLLLLGLYLVRGSGAPQEPERVLSTQFAASAPAAPTGPPPDPYGDKPIDLTPPAPAPLPQVAAAPTPASAAPACPSSRSLRAWFCTDKSDLTDAAKVALDRDLEQWSQCFADRELVVSGYADTRGPEVYNSWLGEMRASTVAEYLRGKGVRVAQLTGVGELSGLDDNQDCSNQRRVDIMFSGETEEPSRSCAPPQEVAELVCG